MNLQELNKSSICAQVWNGVTIKPNGAAGICCEVTDELDGMNIRTHTFEQMMHHPKMIYLRNEMLQGKKPKECSNCWQKEHHGAPSLRHELNDAYFTMNKDKTDFDPDEIIPGQNLEIVLGNLCQLSCVMCHPSRSKKVEKAFEHVIKMDFRKSYEGLVGTLPDDFDTSWVEDTTVWDSISEEAQAARRIYLNGGEPLLARQHERILQKLIEGGKAKHTHLNYSTNGFLLDDSHIEMWRNFDRVDVTFSLDDLGERNHFIRYPSNFDGVKKSLDRIVEWQKDKANSPIHFGVWCAINFLNFAYLPEFIEFFATQYPTIAIKGWRAIQVPNYLNPENLPKQDKERIAGEIFKMIDKYPSFNHLRSDINLIVNSNDNPDLLVDGIAYMKTNADFYKVNLEEVFSKLSYLM